MGTEQSDQQCSCCCVASAAGGRWLMWLVIAALVVAGVCAVAYHSAVGKRKASAPYRMALEVIKNDPAVVEALGEPIRDATWFPQGTIEERELGEARWDFDVAGPKNKAHVRVTARYIGGKWSLQQLEVTPSGGQTIRIDVHAANEQSEDAPLWTPPAKGSPPPSGTPGPSGKAEPKPPGEKLGAPAPQTGPPEIKLPVPDNPADAPPKIELAPPTPPQ